MFMLAFSREEKLEETLNYSQNNILGIKQKKNPVDDIPCAIVASTWWWLVHSISKARVSLACLCPHGQVP
jgi:hypothetical protein